MIEIPPTLTPASLSAGETYAAPQPSPEQHRVLLRQLRAVAERYEKASAWSGGEPDVGAINHATWLVEPDGSIEVLYQEDLTIGLAHALVPRRRAGLLVLSMYPGLVGVDPSDQEVREIFAAAVSVVFCRVTEGALAGEVVGPLHGSDEVFQFNEALRRLRDVRFDADVMDVLPNDDPALAGSREPWGLLLSIVGDES